MDRFLLWFFLSFLIVELFFSSIRIHPIIIPLGKKSSCSKPRQSKLHCLAFFPHPLGRILYFSRVADLLLCLMEICTKFELAPTFMHHVLLQPQQQSWLRPSHSTIQQPIALNPITVSQRSRWSRSPRSCSLEAQGSSSSSRRSSAAGVMKKATSSSSEQDPSSVSVIIPVFNEVGSIRTLVERVGAVMRRRGAPYEIICVDDGSTDGKNKELSFCLSLYLSLFVSLCVSVSILLLILLLMQEAPSFWKPWQHTERIRGWWSCPATLGKRQQWQQGLILQWVSSWWH